MPPIGMGRYDASGEKRPAFGGENGGAILPHLSGRNGEISAA